ncbi:hypothetical protein [Corynebacterium sp. A21]|uniref:hypothetical protein n=1 Tax=Corynebacterium sp. A21 TaxID=3457318 RepID=UPI003FCFC9C8
MARLFLRITIESTLACVFFLVGVWLIGLDGTLATVLSAASIILGFLLLAHIILAAAFGKVKTPIDLGAGHRVPGTPDRQSLKNSR